MLGTSRTFSQNQAVHLMTACEVLQMENQSPVLSDGNRSVVVMLDGCASMLCPAIGLSWLILAPTAICWLRQRDLSLIRCA
ncbi:hypothetical protein Pla52n_43920 [Stieleria varia]|uniref:Uncharacterized protein n=1 Tax=Stieleria varia TaxID=2528005 RepID=A0A5C6ANM3_9BACT|nr:hypothetical protein Pla52n_43920 [Stieleria varia]